MVMNKRSLRIIICMIFIMVSATIKLTVPITQKVIPTKVNAESDVEINDETEDDTNIDGNNKYKFVITKYKVDMIVNEDNTYDITEYIEVHFNEPQHGIIREIPTRNKVERLDGSKTYNKAKISNIYVDNHYKRKKHLEYYDLIIGDSNRTITGYENYEINYTYDIGNDKSEKFDELYFNLIGIGWNTTISNVEFSITMPKDFHETKLDFSSGIKGSTDSSSIVYNVDGKTINGHFIGVLEPSEGLTVRLELPEGYYIKRAEPGLIIMLATPILCLIITIIFWLKYGRNDKIVETVEFYPPSEYNSAYIGTYSRGYVEDKDVISLLIYLANKGYIKIKEYDEQKLFRKKKSFIITKEKEYDGNDALQEKFMDGLFKDGKEEVKEVTEKMLKNTFYETVWSIKRSLDKSKNKMFDKKSLQKRGTVEIFTFFTLAAIIFVPLTFVPLMEYFSFFKENKVVSIVYVLFALTIYSKITFQIYKKGRIVYMTFLIVLSIALVAKPWIHFMKFVLFSEKKYIYAYIIGYGCFIVMTYFAKAMVRRTPFANEILGKIRGFKRFLRIAEKPKLEALVMEEPNYFYDILPYAYVLDVSDKWIEKFETINMKPPTWYDSDTSYNLTSFNNSVDDTMKNAGKVMTSVPPSKRYSSGSSSSSSSGSSSSSSGGGSSGGGSGGGGGSSW